jgi:hypothetical protein
MTAAQTRSKATTICQIAAMPAVYANKMVSFRAIYAGSFEGSYLVDPICRKSVWFTLPDGNANVAVIAVHGSYPKTPERNFELIKGEEYDKFRKFAYATLENLQPEYKVTAMFTGRIDRCKDFKVNKDGFGNGFGQMGGSEFQLVLLSISEVKAKKAEGVLRSVPSVLSDQIPAKK